MKTLLRAGLALTAVLTLVACQPANDAAFGQKVRAYLLAHPEVLEEALTKLQDKKQAEAVAANDAEIKKVEGLIPKHRAQLERDGRDFVANPNGKITVVEFFDYRCGYCKLAAPEVLKLVAAHPDVRFVFKEYPIFGEESDVAAKVALTPAGKAAGLTLYAGFMGEKTLDEAAIDRHLAQAGVNATQARTAGSDPAIATHLADTSRLAHEMGIEGTPAFIVGEKFISGARIPELIDAIEKAKAGS